MPNLVKTEYPSPPLEFVTKPSGETYRKYTIMRNGVPAPIVEAIHPATGLPLGSNHRYPLRYMVVGDYFVIHRRANLDPKYSSLRVYLINRGKSIGMKFQIIAEEFPNLVVKRTA